MKNKIKITQQGKENFAAITCGCGCGMQRIVKLPKYYSKECFAKAIAKPMPGKDKVNGRS